MAKVGELFVALGIDLTDYQRGLKQAENQAKNFAQNISSYFKDAAKSLEGIGQKMSLAITAPLTLIGHNMLKMAMDAVESENLFTVSMGNMADAARQWSIALSKSLGLNQYELRRNVGMFNVMFRSMGFNEQAAYAMARGLTQLAYDMASFYNLRPEEAFEKLRAGITGEAEPLKALGILVMEEQTKLAAYRYGIAKTGEELTENQKVLARYYAIMEQTAKAQGDLARTIDSPANQARIAKARYEELSVSIGMKLIPVMHKVVTALNKAMVWFEKLPGGMQTAIIASVVLAWAMGPLILTFVGLTTILPKVYTGFMAFLRLKAVKAVIDALTLAFTRLNITLLRNPIVLAIVGISIALLLIARSSKTVSSWLDQVIARLRALAGLDYQPPAPNAEDPAAAAESYADYAAALTNAGDAAGGAAKEFKKFLAAFDEVYQAGEDADQNGGIPGISPVQPPGGGGGGAVGGGDGGGFNIPPIPPTLPPIIWTGIQPPPGAVAEELETALERIRNALLQPLPAVALPGLVPVPDPVPVWVAVLQGIATVLEALKQKFAEVFLPNLLPAPELVPAWQTATAVLVACLAAVAAAALATGTSLTVALAPALALAAVFAAAWVAAGVAVQGVQAALQAAWATLVAAWQAGVAVVQNVTQAIANVWGAALDGIRRAMERFREWAQEVWNRLGESLRGGLQNALAFMQQMWENHKVVVVGIAVALIAAVVAIFAGGPAAIAGALAPLVPAVMAIISRLPGQFSKIISQLPVIVTNIISRIPGIFSSVFSCLPGIVRSVLSSITSTVSSWASRIGSFISGVVSRAQSAFSGGLGGRYSPALAHYAAGGIALTPQVAMVAENEPEAIIPLSKLNQYLAGRESAPNITLQVGTLVADDRSLRELERRLRNIRLNEAARTGAML
jgi:hypothetical protein